MIAASSVSCATNIMIVGSCVKYDHYHNNCR